MRSDSPYKSVKELLAAIKANPGKMKASGTGEGGIWHLAIAGLLKDQGIDRSALRWVPSSGAESALQDMKGNICRCGTYNHIVAAIQRAAGEMQKA